MICLYRAPDSPSASRGAKTPGIHLFLSLYYVHPHITRPLSLPILLSPSPSHLRSSFYLWYIFSRKLLQARNHKHQARPTERRGKIIKITKKPAKIATKKKITKIK